MNATKSYIDPCVCEHYFFQQPTPDEPHDGVCDLLQRALAEFTDGPERNGQLVDMSLTPKSDQLWRSEKRRRGQRGEYVDAEVCRLNDGLVFRRTSTRMDESYDLDDLRNIDDVLPLAKPKAFAEVREDDRFLGSLRVYGVEVDVSDVAHDPEEQAKRLHEHAVDWAEQVLGPTRQPFPTLHGTLVLGAVGQHSEALWVYPKDRPMEFYFFTALSELFLCHVQLLHTMYRLGTAPGDLTKAKRARQDLEAWLKEDTPGEQNLNRLQKFNDDLTSKTAALVDAVAPLHEHLDAIAHQRHIFDRAIASGPFRVASDDVRQLSYVLVDRITNLGEQRARAEIQRSEQTLRRCEFHRQSLEASIDVREARETNTLNYLILALAAVEGVSLLPWVFGDAKFAEWWVIAKLALVGGLAGALPLAWWVGKSLLAWWRKMPKAG